MRHRILSASFALAGALLAAVVLGGGLVGLGLRYRWPFVLDGLRRLSRTTLNPGQMETAGQADAYASIIEHRGRVSGRTYRTPVVVRSVDDGFVVTLTYGTRADWVRNVLAAGSATVIHEGQRFESLDAELTPLDQADAWLSTKERRLLGWFGIETCLRFTPGP